MEIKTREQIFQLPNNFPAREIIPPNLLKARYVRSGKIHELTHWMNMKMRMSMRFGMWRMT